MIEFIKNLIFGSSGPKYPLGALESPLDERNISLASFQKPVNLPVEYNTELTAVRDQGSKPKCVGSAIAELGELYLHKQGIFAELSDDDLYEQCKKVDGIPDIPGTYPSVGAMMAFKNGIATIEAYQTGDRAKIEASRKKHKFGGYAFVGNSFDSICQAIYQNGAVTASLLVDENWFMGIIGKVLRSLGRHYIIFKGFSYSPSAIIRGRNSWGVNWIGRIAGLMDHKIAPGEFEVQWLDIQDTVVDIIAFADIPKEILEEVKTKEYRFNKDLKLGDSGYDVIKLQERLTKEKCFSYQNTGYFGPITRDAVIKYQTIKGINPIGVVGPATRKSLNGPLTLVQAIAIVESGNRLGVIGDVNLINKAYGPLQIRKPCVDDVNDAFNTRYKAEDCLNNLELSEKIFHKYIQLHASGQSDEYKARIWNGGPNGYKKNTTIAYWEKVRKLL